MLKKILSAPPLIQDLDGLGRSVARSIKEMRGLSARVAELKVASAALNDRNVELLDQIEKLKSVLEKQGVTRRATQLLTATMDENAALKKEKKERETAGTSVEAIAERLQRSQEKLDKIREEEAQSGERQRKLEAENRQLSAQVVQLASQAKLAAKEAREEARKRDQARIEFDRWMAKKKEAERYVETVQRHQSTPKEQREGIVRWSNLTAEVDALIDQKAALQKAMEGAAADFARNQDMWANRLKEAEEKVKAAKKEGEAGKLPSSPSPPPSTVQRRLSSTQESPPNTPEKKKDGGLLARFGFRRSSSVKYPTVGAQTLQAALSADTPFSFGSLSVVSSPSSSRPASKLRITVPLNSPEAIKSPSTPKSAISPAVRSPDASKTGIPVRRGSTLRLDPQFNVVMPSAIKEEEDDVSAALAVAIQGLRELGENSPRASTASSLMMLSSDSI